MSTTRRTALTTGANSGLGLATVLELARRGHRSVGTVRSEEKADVVRAAAKNAGLTVETELLEVTDADQCADVIERVSPDILVNNAGYMLYAAVEEATDEEAQSLIDTMVIAPTRLARLCLPAMRAEKWGRIIQVSSLSAQSTFPLMGWYQGTKMALEGVSDALRLEVAGDGIAVVLIQPGLFRSELSNELAAPADRESRYKDAYAQSKAGFAKFERFMTEPATVAKAIGRAVDARHPRARYSVGLDAQFSRFSAPVTPTGLRDFALRRSTGL